MAQEIAHVVALFVAAPGKENELEELLSTLVEPTRKEAGCIKYDLLRGIPGELGDFVFVEEWESVEALDAHSQSEHLQAVGPQTGPPPGAPAHAAPPRPPRHGARRRARGGARAGPVRGAPASVPRYRQIR